MSYTSRRELVKVLEDHFGNRCKPHGKHTGPLATVLPVDAAEIGFFPVVPARPTPAPGRVLVPAQRIGMVLEHLRSGPTELAILGSVARDDSALLLAFAGSGAEGRPESLSAGDEPGLVGIARSAGGELYHSVLKQRAGRSSSSTLGR